MQDITRVHAARRGSFKRDVDETFYYLVLSMKTRQSQIRILETKDAFKIRKHVSKSH